MWRDRIPSVSNRLSNTTGIGSTQPPSGLRINLNGFAVAHTISKTHGVTGLLESLDSIRRESLALEGQLVRRPLIVKAWRGHRLKHVHLIDQNIQQGLQN